MTPQNTSGIYPAYIVERFWSKVALCPHGMECRDCCWPWKECMVSGYGMFGVPKAYRQGRSKSERASRVCWRMMFGTILDELCVLHNCPSGDNSACVNYWHLWLGTNKDNSHDVV